MTKQERAGFRECVKGMTKHDRAWVLNRDVTALLDALEAKDALIAELIEFCDEGWHGQNASERFQQLKARAAQ